MIRRGATLPNTRVWQGEHDITVIDSEAIYMYHRLCGGLMMIHRLDGTPATDWELSCYCYYHPAPLDTQSLLKEVYQSVAKCETVSDARRVIESIAAREEMAEQRV